MSRYNKGASLPINSWASWRRRAPAGRGGGAGRGSEIWQELMGTAWVPDLDSKMGRGAGGQKEIRQKNTAGGKSAPHIFGVCIPSMRMSRACFSGKGGGKKEIAALLLVDVKKVTVSRTNISPSCSNNKGPLLLQAQIWFWFFFLSFRTEGPRRSFLSILHIFHFAA